MQDLVCAHKWSGDIEIREAVDMAEPGLKLRVVLAKRCRWCDAWWKETDPEPRTVIARLE